MKKLDRLILKANNMRRAEIESNIGGVVIIRYDGRLKKWLSSITSGSYTTMKRALSACDQFLQSLKIASDDISIIIDDIDYVLERYAHG